MGCVGRVLISEILAYCELMGIANKAVRAKYLRLLQAMDEVYVDHTMRQMEAEANKSSA